LAKGTLFAGDAFSAARAHFFSFSSDSSATLSRKTCLFRLETLLSAEKRILISQNILRRVALYSQKQHSRWNYFPIFNKWQLINKLSAPPFVLGKHNKWLAGRGKMKTIGKYG